MFSLQLLCASLLIISITVFGGLAIAKGRPRWYSQEKISLLVAVGTGTLLVINFFEFLPVVFKGDKLQSSLLILTGILLVIFVETYVAPQFKFLEGRHCDHDHGKDHDHKAHLNQEHMHHLISHSAACSAVGCLLVCAFFDGIEIVTAFQFSQQIGWLASFGLLFHILPDGVLAASIALAGGMTNNSAKNVSLITGGALLLGLATSFVCQQFVSFQIIVLPVATGVLTYVSLIHLLPISMKIRSNLFWLAGSSVATFILLHVFDHPH